MELKPCPFCGGEAEMIKDWRNQRGRWTDSYRIRCARCPIEDIYWHVSEVAAIKKWNTRAERRCKNMLSPDWGTFECSECGGQFAVAPVYITSSGTPNDDLDPSCVNYCPSCGAKVVE